MKIRKLSFGYCIQNGKICVDERSADTVRMIFDHYVQLASYEKLADMLERQGIPYIAGKRWNKNIVARILKDRHYMGDNEYPALLSQESFLCAETANCWFCESPEQMRVIKELRSLVRCPSCGGSMLRNCRANWRCPKCMKTSVKLTDKSLIIGVTELLAQLREQAHEIEIPGVVSENNEANGLEEAFVQELNSSELDEVSAKSKVMQLAAAPRVITIPAKPELPQAKAVQRQLRVAAYCRVSTDSEEQLTSYEAQKNYYTDKIMTNPQWTMAGIFADEGITGTSAKKRPEFLKMIRKCRQKKIDLILVKSISRFARNTVDCLNYMRVLKSLGIAIIFEEQNINTLEIDSEMLVTMMGAFAQVESESLSGNVQWGIRQAMREGRVHYQYRWWYGYEKGEDSKPKIIPEQAEVVRQIYDKYLAGHSLRMIKESLEQNNILTVDGGTQWSISVIRGILKNEKYCGDALMQKTFTQDCISKKQIRNVGQLPMYLAPDSHEGIVSRGTYNAVQAEMARRNARKAPSRNKAPTGRGCYSAKYALTERLVCGECGTLYRRCVWSKRGTKRVVWRCASRVDYGTTYCRNSPTLDEGPLQEAILNTINSVMSPKEVLIGQITSAMRTELVPLPGGTMSLADIDCRLEVLNQEFQRLFAKSRDSGGYMQYADTFKRITNDMADLKEKRAALLEQQNSDSAANRRIQDAVNILENGSAAITEWDESMIRQLVDTVKVLSADRIKVYLRGGIEIEQTIREGR